MPSSMAHLAVGAAVLSLAGASRREATVGGLVGAAPDLDAVSGLAWTLLAPHLPLGADALILGEHLLGHRGFSHSLVSAVLVAVLAWRLAGSRRWGAVAGAGWGLHGLLDVFTNWAARPLWPLSGVRVRYPLVTTLEPILTVVATLAAVALVGPAAARRIGWPSAGRRRRLGAWGRRRGLQLAYASLGVILLNVAWIGSVAAVQDVPLGATHSGGIPRTVTVLDRGEAWEVQTRWSPLDAGEAREVPRRDDRTEDGSGTAAMAAAACALDGLGPYRLSHEPFLVARDEGDAVVVRVRDVVGNATEGVPFLEMRVVGGEVQEVWVTGDGPGPEPRFPVPRPVVEQARC